MHHYDYIIVGVIVTCGLVNNGQAITKWHTVIDTQQIAQLESITDYCSTTVIFSSSSQTRLRYFNHWHYTLIYPAGPLMRS